MRILILLLFISSAALSSAQTLTPIQNSGSEPNSGLRILSKEQLNSNSNLNGGVGRGGETSNNKIAEFERPPVTDYRAFTVKNDTIIVDTSLTVRKDYKFNYLRRDNYGLLPFANAGQSYNTLVKDFDGRKILPKHMAQARHFNYQEEQDVMYYHVPTPLTELYYRTVFEQGQNLESFFTMNTSKQFNFFVGYKGLRSLGKYQHQLTSTGNFRTGFSYNTKNNKYRIKAHWMFQDLFNNENGGLTAEAQAQFESGDADFDERTVLDVNFEDAQNILEGIRVYAHQEYDLFVKKDSLNTQRLSVGHVFNSENKNYRFSQGTAATQLFGDAFSDSDFRDRVDLEEFSNEINVTYNDQKLGTLNLKTNWLNYVYGYNTTLIQDVNADGELERIPNQLAGDVVSIGAAYNNTIGKLTLSGAAAVNVFGDFKGSQFNGEVAYLISKATHPKLGKINLKGGVSLHDFAPAYNHLLTQSNYINYNWYNKGSYENSTTFNINGEVEASKFINLSASYAALSNHAYFLGTTELLGDDLEGYTRVQSMQSAEVVNHLKVTAQRQINVGKFALDVAGTYQNIAGAQGVINVPEFYTRNSLFFTDRWFKKALFVQTGFTFTYFTPFTVDGYDPVLAEFYTQNQHRIGGFPLVDFFVNLKVRQTRIFFKAEHFNSPFTGSNYYSAPGYPYRDFNIRFGLVWNFFL